MVNFEIHHINTRQHANFYQPSLNVAKYQKGVYYLDAKVFNVLPSDIKTGFNNPMKFNPLPVQFKALLHGQKGCVFFSGHLNLRTTPETGLPSREKNHNN